MKDQSPNLAPSKNMSQAVSFILRGAEKRRSAAIQKARALQFEMGVVPKLVCIK
jgi:hypothetical protein